MAYLNPRRLRQLHDALLSAFPTKAELTQMVRFGLGEHLDSIAAGSTTSDIMFNLLEWAESHGRLNELIREARAERPQNPALQAFIEQQEEVGPITFTSSQQAEHSTTEDAYAYFNKGVDHYLATDYDEAIEAYTHAIRLKPDFATAYENRGGAYFMRGQDYNHDYYTIDPDYKDFQRAIADYSNALRIQPTARLYRNRGVAFMVGHAYEPAIADYTAAISLVPSDFEAYYLRGIAYRSIGRYDRSITDLSLVIDNNPDYALAYSARAKTFYDLYHKHILESRQTGYGRMAQADYRKVLGLSNDAQLRRDAESALALLAVVLPAEKKSLPVSAKKSRPWWQRFFLFLFGD